MTSLIKTYARPTRSSLYGVGAKAIQKISKGTVVAPATDINGKWYHIKEIHKIGIIEPGPIEMMFDFVCGGPENDEITGEYIFVPDNPLTVFPLQMFINHSLNPNIEITNNNKLIAIKDINVGEELTENYDNVCGPKFVKQMFL